jgi:hypothetical protein
MIVPGGGEVRKVYQTHLEAANSWLIKQPKVRSFMQFPVNRKIVRYPLTISPNLLQSGCQQPFFIGPDE